MQRPHILILSRRCQHSREAYTILQNNECGVLVELVWVEDRKVRIPTYVKCTPFLLTNTGHKYTDNDLFFFVERILPSQLAQLRGQAADADKAQPGAAVRPSNPSNPNNVDNDVDGPAPFITNGMETGFSQAFSFLDDTQDSTFCRQETAVADYQKIECPPDDSVKIKKNDDNALDRLRQQRERDVHGMVSSQSQRI